MKTHNITIETAFDADVFPVPIRHLRNRSRRISNPDSISNRRAYLRRLRAAEMAAWEQTGGDYLRSDYVAHYGNQIELCH